MLRADWDKFNIKKKSLHLKSLMSRLMEVEENIGKDTKRLECDRLLIATLREEVEDISKFERYNHPLEAAKKATKVREEKKIETKAFMCHTGTIELKS